MAGDVTTMLSISTDSNFKRFRGLLLILLYCCLPVTIPKL